MELRQVEMSVINIIVKKKLSCEEKIKNAQSSSEEQ